MKALHHAFQQSGGAGKPLPPITPHLASLKALLRRSQLALIAGPPGAGKSIISNIYTADADVPALYCSADTDPYTTTTRVAAHLTNTPQDVVEQALKDPTRAPWYVDRVAALEDKVRWSFDPHPTVEDIAEEALAFYTVYGEMPHLIVIDNLGNVDGGEDDEVKNARRVMDHLNILSKATGACVLVLHHLVGEFEDGDRPAGLGGLSGKVGKPAGLVFTLYRTSRGNIGVCVVKNRFGPADARARDVRAYLEVDMECVQVRDSIDA